MASTPVSTSSTNTPIVKQYFKEHEPYELRLTINNPRDFGFNKGLEQSARTSATSARDQSHAPEVEHVSHHCVLTHDALDRLQQPTVDLGRSGSPPCASATPASWRSSKPSAALPICRRFSPSRPPPPGRSALGRPYSAAQMTYDLRRLRLRGLIHAHPDTHRYTVDELRPEASPSSIASSTCASSGPTAPALWRPTGRFPARSDTAFEQLDRGIQAHPPGGRTCCLKNLSQPIHNSRSEPAKSVVVCAQCAGVVQTFRSARDTESLKSSLALRQDNACRSKDSLPCMVTHAKYLSPSGASDRQAAGDRRARAEPRRELRPATALRRQLRVR